MIFSLILVALILLGIHLFVMRSIDSFEGYGGGGTFREWEQFEKKYRNHFENHRSSLM
jgi:hypothetical protein